MSSLMNLRKQVGVSYIGDSRQSAKMMYSYNHKVETYCIYLAPADMSGYNVCPNSRMCRDVCLHGSGHNKADILGGHNMINRARIRKTRLFYENRDLFMEIVIREIESKRRHAKKHGLGFAVRLNGTSDLSPERFIYQGRNILEIFPDIQFYDYTKVKSRLKLMERYPNYDLTYSFDGKNWDTCEEFLKRGGKVAVVFESTIPLQYKAFPVTDANDYDMRYMDPAGHIMGLHYHPVAANYKDGKYVAPDTKFVVKTI